MPDERYIKVKFAGDPEEPEKYEMDVDVGCMYGDALQFLACLVKDFDLEIQDIILAVSAGREAAGHGKVLGFGYDLG